MAVEYLLIECSNILLDLNLIRDKDKGRSPTHVASNKTQILFSVSKMLRLDNCGPSRYLRRISFKSWKSFFHFILWVHDEQRTVYIRIVIRLFPVDLELEYAVIEKKTLQNTSLLDENVAIKQFSLVQKLYRNRLLYFTETKVWLTIDNSEIDVFWSSYQHQTLGFIVSNRWELNFCCDKSALLMVDGYIFEMMKSAKIWNCGYNVSYEFLWASFVDELRLQCSVGMWRNSDLRDDSCIEPYFKGLCVKHISHRYRDS